MRVRRHAESLTADWKRFASINDYRSWFLLGIERARRHTQSRLADLSTAEEMMPGRAQEWMMLRDIVHESLSHAELTGRLVDPSISTRLSTLLRLMRMGAYREDLFQHACLALMPDMYRGTSVMFGVNRRARERCQFRRIIGMSVTDRSTSVQGICVIILTMNQREKTLRCLESLLSIRNPPFRTILWDNGSQDGTAEAVQVRFPQVIVHHHPENLGLFHIRASSDICFAGITTCGRCFVGALRPFG
jgi:hypothetical protein